MGAFWDNATVMSVERVMRESRSRKIFIVGQVGRSKVISGEVLLRVQIRGDAKWSGYFLAEDTFMCYFILGFWF